MDNYENNLDVEVQPQGEKTPAEEQGPAMEVSEVKTLVELVSAPVIDLADRLNALRYFLVSLVCDDKNIVETLASVVTVMRSKALNFSTMLNQGNMSPDYYPLTQAGLDMAAAEIRWDTYVQTDLEMLEEQITAMEKSLRCLLDVHEGIHSSLARDFQELVEEEFHQGEHCDTPPGVVQ